MRRATLTRVAWRVSRILGKQDCVLVGGLAVAAHGYVRATLDVDFVTRLPLAEARDRLRAHEVDAAVARGDRLEGDFSCVKCTLEGVRVDVLPQLVPIAWDKAADVPLTRTRSLRIVDLESLLRLKCRASGPRDLMDAAALVLRHPRYRKLVDELARAYGVTDRLSTWLNDPRLRREMAEARKAER
jgi:hypothetical protein